jgi:lipopolysaccharide transport system ATP-binding protein
MQDVSKGEGRTVLFVSHNMGSIRQLCTRGVVLDKGLVAFDGNVNDAIGLYMRDKSQEGNIIDFAKINNPIVQLDKVLIDGNEGNHIYVTPEKNWFDVNIMGNIAKELKMSLEIKICDSSGSPLFFFSPYHNDSPLMPVGPFNFNYRVELPKGLTKGVFYGGMEIVNSMICSYVDLHNSFIIDSEGYTMPNGFVMDHKFGAVCL